MSKTLLLWQVGLTANVKLHFFFVLLDTEIQPPETHKNVTKTFVEAYPAQLPVNEQSEVPVDDTSVQDRPRVTRSETKQVKDRLRKQVKFTLPSEQLEATAKNKQSRPNQDIAFTLNLKNSFFLELRRLKQISGQSYVSLLDDLITGSSLYHSDRIERQIFIACSEVFSKNTELNKTRAQSTVKKFLAQKRQLSLLKSEVKFGSSLPIAAKKVTPAPPGGQSRSETLTPSSGQSNVQTMEFAEFPTIKQEIQDCDGDFGSSAQGVALFDLAEKEVSIPDLHPNITSSLQHNAAGMHQNVIPVSQPIPAERFQTSTGEDLAINNPSVTATRAEDRQQSSQSAEKHGPSQLVIPNPAEEQNLTMSAKKARFKDPIKISSCRSE